MDIFSECAATPSGLVVEDLRRGGAAGRHCFAGASGASNSGRCGAGVLGWPHGGTPLPRVSQPLRGGASACGGAAGRGVVGAARLVARGAGALAGLAVSGFAGLPGSDLGVEALGLSAKCLSSDMEALRGIQFSWRRPSWTRPCSRGPATGPRAGRRLGRRGASAGRLAAGGSMAVRRGFWRARCAPTRRRRWAGWASWRPWAAGRRGH